MAQTRYWTACTMASRCMTMNSGDPRGLWADSSGGIHLSVPSLWQGWGQAFESIQTTIQLRRYAVRMSRQDQLARPYRPRQYLSPLPGEGSLSLKNQVGNEVEAPPLIVCSRPKLSCSNYRTCPWERGDCNQCAPNTLFRSH
jgi:hypothetical protein